MSRGTKILLVIMGAVLLALVSFVGGCRTGQATTPAPPPPDTIRIHTTDTLRIASVPDTVTNTVIRYVSVPVYIRDTDTIREPVTVPLPFEQHFASIGDVADVWFSGYQARIDSAVAYEHHTTELIRQPYEVPKMPSLTLDLGVGAMWHEQAVKPFVVGKLNLNRPHTTFTAFGAVNPDGDWAAGLTVTYRLNLIK